MPPNVQSPVRIPKAMAVLDASYGGMGRNFQNFHMREVGRRRIFVQVDTGNVLGLELDRDEKPQSVKKRVQAALCVPTEQSSPSFW
ncbi:hypothetical protein O6H91_Y377300 [Diphasiastrum complanatum]|nr:hypothetical protein O6H91_Y377300 [Diphasiastrum complanatum]